MTSDPAITAGDRAWLAALESHQTALLDAVQATGDDARAGIVAGVASYLVWHAEHRDDALVLRQPGPTRDRSDAWRARTALNRPFLGTLLGWWAGHADAGRLRPLPPVVIHALWLGPARDLCDLWLQGAVPDAPAGYAGELGEAAWRCVGPSDV